MASPGAETTNQESQPDKNTKLLSARAEHYRQETEKVVLSVGEHPQYELKRSFDLSNLNQKLELVKDIQAIATSNIETEKYLVIGADETSHTLREVTNLHEFDDAKIYQQLDKYLSPVPSYELFRLKSSEGIPFVLFVFGKQPTRRILAKITVNHPADLKPTVLLREGDLWTKGDSTGRRLARGEDWDAIYDEKVEREAEARTRTRTDHFIQQVIAQERIKAVSGGSFVIPAYLSDEEYKTIVEDIAGRNDETRLSILLERLRDDLIEGWHKVGGYQTDLHYSSIPSVATPSRETVRSYRDGVFRPSMQRLILLCIQLIKFRTNHVLFGHAIDLLIETFKISNKLTAIQRTSQKGLSKNIDEHVSNTIPALESLIGVFTIGAYIAKRRRFDYLPFL